jgi:hypothetical protein
MFMDKRVNLVGTIGALYVEACAASAVFRPAAFFEVPPAEGLDTFFEALRRSWRSVNS